MYLNFDMICGVYGQFFKFFVERGHILKQKTSIGPCKSDYICCFFLLSLKFFSFYTFKLAQLTDMLIRSCVQ